MASHVLAVGFALAAAFLAAVGIVVRQWVTAAGAADAASVSRGWVRDPLWWAGTAAAIAGYVFQALALAHGSLLLVQPLLVSSLLFAMPLSAALCRQRISVTEWGWALLLTAALAVFVVVGQPHEGHYRPPVAAWAVALCIAVPVVAGCGWGAHRRTGRVRAMLLGLAVAVLLGMVAVLTKVCTHRLRVGGWHALMTVPAPYVLVGLAIGVTVMQQMAFHAGALEASVPIMLVGEPVVAVALGVVVLGEHLTVKGPLSLLLPVAVVAMVVSAAALSRGSVRAPSTPRSAQSSPPTAGTRDVSAVGEQLRGS